MRVGSKIGLFSTVMMLGACADDAASFEPERDDRTPIIAEDPPPPISGGTLLVTASDLAVVADPDRDRVSLVSVDPPKVLHDVAFEHGDEPTRVVEGSGDLVHVVLRGSGSVASVDVASGEIVARRAVCNEPQGMDFDAAGERLFVACADGMLVDVPELAADGEVVRHWVEPDLRDVVVDGDRLLVSRLRSAQVLEISLDAGLVLARNKLPGSGTARPTVAWRLRRLAPGVVGMLHQFSETTPVPISAPPPEPDTPDPPPSPYGGGGEGSCGLPLVRPAITTWTGDERGTIELPGPGPAVDLARSPSGEFALALAGAPDDEGDVRISSEFPDPCTDTRLDTPGQPTAVAYTSSGWLLVQSREPSHLYVYSPAHEHTVTIELTNTTRFDTGHDLFHRATGTQLACASCHPIGEDDGHVWTFEELGPRRTQNLAVGLAGSEPLHWNGDMSDFSELANEVYTHRMGGPLQSAARTAAFEGWLFSLERPAASSSSFDASVVARGEALFSELGCVACHAGERMTNDRTVQLRGESLQVPSLRRVSVRAPYMHDGRAANLRAAIMDMVAATNPGAQITSTEATALEAFLGTR
jgi:mono/diheme cytochrome c family protein